MKLTVDKLHVFLSGREVLHNVSVEAVSGQLVGLIGPNGAGKTTLMRAILGLVRAHSGSVLLDGQRPAPGAIGYVPQLSGTDWTYPMSVQDLIATSFTAKRRRVNWEKVYKALETVELLDHRNRHISELSGGQKQRVIVARALATDPAVLLLDEPFTGLDYPNQDALAALFYKLAHSGCAILMSSHDLPQAMDMCSRIIMLNHHVRAAGAPADLRAPGPWMETFSVGPNSSLLRTLGVSASSSGCELDDYGLCTAVSAASTGAPSATTTTEAPTAAAPAPTNTPLANAADCETALSGAPSATATTEAAAAAAPAPTNTPSATTKGPLA